MKVLVIGAGLIGVATAYFLSSRGYEVTVLDRQDGPGRETSFANGALLHPSMPEPWNAPGCWRVLLRSLGRSDAALQLHLRMLPGAARWGAAFLWNARLPRFERNTQNNLRLARYSLEIMKQLREDTEIDYGHAARGSLRIFRNPRALAQAGVAGRRLSSEGLAFRKLSSSEAVRMEPALEPLASRLAGAIHYEADEIGDAHRFCVELSECAGRKGTRFRFGIQVRSLERSSDGLVKGAITDHECFVADCYLVAAGSFTPLLLRGLGVRLPVQPAKGYSITLRCDRGCTALSIPIIDDQLHAAIVPLGDAIRVAGTAEFAGYDLSLRSERVSNLLALLKAVLPEGRLDTDRFQSWCGLRPMSPDGVPLVGRTPIPNLWVNTGHGHLGWTMAAGSGQLLVDLLAGQPSAIDPAPYDPRRFLN